MALQCHGKFAMVYESTHQGFKPEKISIPAPKGTRSRLVTEPCLLPRGRVPVWLRNPIYFVGAQFQFSPNSGTCNGKKPELRKLRIERMDFDDDSNVKSNLAVLLNNELARTKKIS